MKVSLAASAALLFGAGLSAAAIAQHPRSGARATAAAIRAIEDGWNRDWARKDVARLAAHYTRDAVLMAPGARMVGIAQIRAGLTQMTSDPALSLRFHAERVEVSASGDLAYTQGTYTFRSTDPRTHQPVEDHGSYVTTYRRQADGSWKAVDDIASSGTRPG
jgi:uncharacterized protein (TIGR02246 family)